jgi:bla regulator protein blaR1
MTLIVTWLWQGLIIAWMVAAAIRVLPRLNAATRHAIWWSALAAVVSIPVAHGLAEVTMATPPADFEADVTGALVLPAIPAGVLAGLFAIWAITATLGVFRIVLSCRALARLKRTSLPFDRAREARLPLWVKACNSDHRAAELRVSDCISGACALGLGRPVVLVSRAVADALSDESLDEIVMHEQAHLDRYDDWSQLLEAFVGSLAGLHPAVGFLIRRLALDREAACDDRVVRSTGASRRYASALLAVAAVANPGGRRVEFSAAISRATTTASALRVRVSRILDPGRARGARATPAARIISVTALSVAVAMLTRVAPIAVFLETASVNVPIEAASLAIDTPLASAPIPSESVSVTVDRFADPRRPAPVDAGVPARSDTTATAVQSVARISADPAPAVPLDSRVLRAAVNVPVLAIPPPSTAMPAQPVAPWEAVASSAVATADSVAHTAAEAGVQARVTSSSIGRRLVTRARQVGANVF